MNEESRRDAITRSRMVAAIRRALDEQGFVEVETPVLQSRYGGAFVAPSSPTTTSSTRISTCVSPPSSTSSA